VTRPYLGSLEWKIAATLNSQNRDARGMRSIAPTTGHDCVVLRGAIRESLYTSTHRVIERLLPGLKPVVTLW
jgi:hypothetical protein